MRKLIVLWVLAAGGCIGQVLPLNQGNGVPTLDANGYIQSGEFALAIMTSGGALAANSGLAFNTSGQVTVSGTGAQSCTQLVSQNGTGAAGNSVYVWGPGTVATVTVETATTTGDWLICGTGTNGELRDSLTSNIALIPNTTVVVGRLVGSSGTQATIGATATVLLAALGTFGQQSAALTGDVTKAAGSGATTVTSINNVLLSSLANGVETFASGVPSALGYTPVKDAGDLGGTAAAPTVLGINGSPFTYNNGAALAANSTLIVNSSGNVTQGGTTAASCSPGLVSLNGTATTSGVAISVAAPATIVTVTTDNAATAGNYAGCGTTSGHVVDLGQNTLSAIPQTTVIVGQFVNLPGTTSGTAAAAGTPTLAVGSRSGFGTQTPALTGDVTKSAGSSATIDVGINGTLLSGLGAGVLKQNASGIPSIASSPTDFLKVNTHVADTAVAVGNTTTTLAHTQGLLSSGSAAGFYRIVVAETITTAGTGAGCAGPIALTATNDQGSSTAVTISAGPTFTAAAGTMTQATYSFYDAGTTATTLTLTPNGSCTAANNPGVYNMYSTIERLF